MTSASSRAGFTLVEILTVMIVIAILMGIVVFTARAVIRDNQEKTVKLTLRNLRSAMDNYANMYSAPPFDSTDTVNSQIAAAVDNMTNLSYAWNRRRKPLLELKNFDLSATNPLEVVDLWDQPFILKVMDPNDPVPPAEHVACYVGQVEVMFYSRGRDGVPQKGLGVNDDIGVGGSRSTAP